VCNKETDDLYLKKCLHSIDETTDSFQGKNQCEEELPSPIWYFFADFREDNLPTLLEQEKMTILLFLRLYTRRMQSIFQWCYSPL
jgi:hypothetical protein